jgi:hypothetical protein
MLCLKNEIEIKYHDNITPPFTMDTLILENEHLKHEIMELKNENKYLHETVAEFEKQNVAITNSDLEMRVYLLETDHIYDEHNHEQYNIEIAKLNSYNMILRSNIQYLRNDNSKLHKRIQELETENKTQREQIEGLISEVCELKTENKTQREQISELKFKELKNRIPAIIQDLNHRFNIETNINTFPRHIIRQMREQRNQIIHFLNEKEEPYMTFKKSQYAIKTLSEIDTKVKKRIERMFGCVGLIDAVVNYVETVLNNTIIPLNTTQYDDDELDEIIMDTFL